jgi:hypothetical protein
MRRTVHARRQWTAIVAARVDHDDARRSHLERVDVVPPKGAVRQTQLVANT